MLADHHPFKMVKITVVLRDPKRAIVEQGAAIRDGPESWKYCSTKAWPRNEPIRLEVVATDRLGKTDTKRFIGLLGARSVMLPEKE